MVCCQFPLPALTHEPPYKQMLIGVGQALWPSSSPPHFLTHPSTLRAGARSSGRSSLSPIVSPPHHCSTHQAPHKQLVMRLGVGGLSSVVLCRSTHHSPHEQLLMRLEVHGVSSVVSGSKGVGGISDVACVKGSGSAYRGGIPLAGSPSVAHHPPVPK